VVVPKAHIKNTNTLMMKKNVNFVALHRMEVDALIVLQKNIDMDMGLTNVFGVVQLQLEMVVLIALPKCMKSKYFNTSLINY
jgi:hypothetical protein